MLAKTAPEGPPGFTNASKQRKCKNLQSRQSIKYLPLMNRRASSFNILPANFIENLLPPRDKKQKHENSDE